MVVIVVKRYAYQNRAVRKGGGGVTLINAYF